MRSQARRNVQFKDYFSEHSAAYATHRPSYPTALVDLVADVAGTRELAWDAGCGSGQMSVPLAARFEHVVATDASAEQIARATRHARVEYHTTPAEASGLTDGIVDLAVAAQAAHWFSLPAYYDEVRRVARPGAAIALVTYGLTSIDDDIDSVVDHFYSDVLAPYWSPERRHVEDGYRSLPFPFAEIATPTLELTADWSMADLFGYVATWSAVRALERAQGRSAVDAFCRDLERAWGPADEVRRVRWPLALRLGRIER